MKDIFTNTGVRIVLLLLVDLIAPAQYIWWDLNGPHESIAALGGLQYILIGIVIHLVTMFFLRRIGSKYFTQVKSWGAVSANMFIIAVILLWTLFLIVAPSYVEDSIKPFYDSYARNTAIKDLKQLETLYMEPSYLPPQVKFINKRSEEESSRDGYVGGFASITTTYVCPELNKSTFGNVSVSESVNFGKYNLQNPETVMVSGKEAIFVGDSHLVQYDGNITRSVFNSGGQCGVTKDDLVKIMGSLQPAQFVSGTATM